MIIGEILSHYRVTGKLGAGGMGEVYRATDTRLGRDVALKVLPESYAGDTYRMGRFEREAQVLASLNHSSIAALFGLEEQDGKRALVMELVEGQTLAECIQQGAIPIEETLIIAKQIAGALEYAHERGIIHRDLKPSNIKLTTEGQVKLLDFGLARALADDSYGSDAANSPTLSAMATMAGMILGTAGYMSPEQAKGKPADRRADIWSFGAVLYEMLARKQLYSGETTSEILAGVIKEEPDWSALPPDTPLAIRKLLRRCLTKDANRRLQSIGEARIAIEEYLGDPNASSAIVSEVGTASRTPAWRRALPWAMAGLFLLTTAIALWSPWKRPKRSEPPMHLSIELGIEAASLSRGNGASMALSPDGTTLVFAAKAADGTPRLYVRPLTQTEAVPLPDTEGAQSPFFSPDGRWVGFFGHGRLRKVELQGGSSVELCRAGGARGGSWSGDGSIVFAPAPTGGLFRVSAMGGTPEPLTKLDGVEGEITHRWPQVLPGGQAVLFTAHNAVGSFSGARVVLYSIKDGTRKVILRGAMYPRYLPSGHLLYLREGGLYAAPFDVKRQEITGAAAPVFESVAYSETSGGAEFSFSETGLFAYVPGKGFVGGASIQWMDASGQLRPLRSTPMSYRFPRFSPDGMRLAVTVNEPSTDIWLYDWLRDTFTRLTFGPGRNEAPVWTPDGQRLAFASDRDGGPENIYWQRADGTGPVQRLTESKNEQIPWSWTPHGEALLFVEVSEGRMADIWKLPMEGNERSGWKPGKPQVLLNSPFVEYAPAVSPDGRWLAYASNESGMIQVYVTPFPSGSGKWQVSSSRGQYPMWSPNGRDLFYENGEDESGQMMVATYTESPGSFRAEKPRLWSPARFTFMGPSPTVGLHPDGKRFAVLEQSKEPEIGTVTLIQGFLDEVRRRVPNSKN